MTAASEPAPHGDVAPGDARALLDRAAALDPGTPRDRHRHALALLAGGVVMAAVAAAGALTDGLGWTIGTWALAVLVLLGIGRLTDRASRSTPRGMERAARVASWTGFGMIVVGRPVLDLVYGAGTPPPLGGALLGVAVLLPFAVAAHRIRWGAWIPRGQR
ncbi:hypothetical protein M1843_06330 [Isoptericola sp. 4D.3]|uniref:Uncharacterized protein n=1 Tax=Isoptericola peretonis TaxID=2918523 RepID=A0ABT0J1I1_9MICO|nr:hypothetical protein [Isoptericola sp. 4D.3]